MRQFIGVVLLCCVAQQGFAQDVAARFDLRYKVGNKRQITSPELFLPLQQNNNSLLFADIRAAFDGNHNKEGNLGLGYRQFRQNHILGGYGFFDRRQSQYGAYHSQATIGAELLTENWDFRINAYAPLTGKKVATPLSVADSFELVGNQLIRTVGATAYERSMAGFDAEVGYQLLPGLRVFGGVYNFRAHDVPEVEGYRFRAQYEINDHFRAGLEYQRDDVRGEQRYAELRLRIPLQKEDKKALTGLRKRMAEPVVRDIDIVTFAARPVAGVDYTPSTEAVDNPDTGNPHEIWYVNNAASSNGSGSIESPFDNLADALSAAGANDIIYVYQGTGSVNTGTINLTQDNLQFIGSGTNLVFNPNTGRIQPSASLQGTILIASTDAPSMSAPASTIITADGDNQTIAGISFGNASIAIANSAGIDNLTILDSVFSNSDRAISLSTLDGVSISDVTITNTGTQGIYLNNVNTVSLSEISISDDDYSSSAIQYDRDIAGPTTFNATGINFAGANAYGLLLNVLNDANISATLSDVTNTSDSLGFYLNASNTSDLSLMVDNYADSIGFYSQLMDSATFDLTMINSTLTGSAYVDTQAYGDNTVTINMSATSFNDSANFVLGTNGNSQAVTNLSNVDLLGSGQSLFELNDSSQQTVTVSDSQISNGIIGLETFNTAQLAASFTRVDLDGANFNLRTEQTSQLDLDLTDVNIHDTNRAIRGNLRDDSVTNLTLNNVDIYANSEYGLYLTGFGSTVNVAVNDSSIYNNTNAGIYLANDVVQVTLNNTSVHDNGEGIYISGTGSNVDITLNDSDILDNTARGIFASLLNITDLDINVNNGSDITNNNIGVEFEFCDANNTGSVNISGTGAVTGNTTDNIRFTNIGACAGDDA